MRVHLADGAEKTSGFELAGQAQQAGRQERNESRGKGMESSVIEGVAARSSRCVPGELDTKFAQNLNSAPRPVESVRPQVEMKAVFYYELQRGHQPHASFPRE